MNEFDYQNFSYVYRICSEKVLRLFETNNFLNGGAPLKTLILSTISLIFLFSSLNLSDVLSIKGIVFVYGLLISLILVPLFVKKKNIIINLPALLTFYVFTLFCIISSLINNDFESLLGAIMISLLFLVSFIILPMANLDTNRTVFIAILVSQIPILAIPLLNGYETAQYQGIFFNPNALGTIATTVFAALLASLLMDLENVIKEVKERRSKAKILFKVSLLILVFYLIIISASRTSFAASLICLFIGCSFLLLYLIKYKRITKFIIKSGFIALVGSFVMAILLRFTSFYEIIYLNILYKFEDSMRRGDLLSNRDTIWQLALDDSKFFGSGNNYFTELGIGAHNTFISILGHYGWIPLLMFLVFLVSAFYYSTKLSLSNTKDSYKYLPLLLFISFITLSMGEDMIFHLSMVATFFSLGSVLKKKQSTNTVKVMTNENTLNGDEAIL